MFFDQRGVEFWWCLTGPVAATEYYQQDAKGVTRKQEKPLKKTASTFATDCVNELGSTELLPILGTEARGRPGRFRQIIGDEKFWA